MRRRDRWSVHTRSHSDRGRTHTVVYAVPEVVVLPTAMLRPGCVTLDALDAGLHGQVGCVAVLCVRLLAPTPHTPDTRSTLPRSVLCSAHQSGWRQVEGGVIFRHQGPLGGVVVASPLPPPSGPPPCTPPCLHKAGGWVSRWVVGRQLVSGQQRQGSKGCWECNVPPTSSRLK